MPARIFELDRRTARHNKRLCTYHPTGIGVVGGSGFSWLVSLLLIRHPSVRIIDVNPSQNHPELLVTADVRHREALHQACRSCDALYKLVAEHDNVRPVKLCHQVNVVAAHNTCD